ncbi:Reverse transcriptase domain [Trinorchestia longiramus]|nr:Reverse transcriptase domain [Trinorchestia longiramus]
MWEPAKPANTTGRNIAQMLLDDPSISLITPPSLPTDYNVYQNSFSTLNLTFVSANFQLTVAVTTEEDMGSDHYPVVTSIGVAPSTAGFRKWPTWKFGSGTWENWTAILQQPELQGMDDLQREFTNFTSNLIEASHKVFKKTKEHTWPKYNKSWWSSKCAAAVKAKQEVKIVLINQPSQVNLIAYKRCQALVKHEVKNAKKESWISFCNSITTDTSTYLFNTLTPKWCVCVPLRLGSVIFSDPSGDYAYKVKFYTNQAIGVNVLIWKCIKNLQTPFCKKAQPILTNNAIITDSVSKANALADHYQERLTSPSPSSFPQHTLILLAIAFNDDTPSVINDPFNIQELNRGLSSMRGTATGHDDIHNEHLKHMPDNYKTWLLQLYNKRLQSRMLLPAWQPAIIIPLLKPNKPLTSVASYRPISLLSCVQKLMERLIVSRLTLFLEQKGVFRKTQGGYRRRLSAIDQVTKLETAIRSTLVNESIMLCFFVDFSSAFDTVWPMGVLYKLSRCGVRGTMLRWLQAYLKDRPFKVFMEGAYSSERIARSGVPQGAVLSPLLFNIMMYDTPVQEGICSCEYADDLAFYTQHPNLRIATDTLQQQFTALHNWSKQWGLKINFNKTKCMFFTNKRINPLPITVGGWQLEFTKQFKYLGVMLDFPQLRWHHQVEYLKQSCAPLLNLLQSISHRHWGAGRELLIYLYKTLIRSRLDYAAPLYDTAALSNLQLNSIQHHRLRIATGYRKTSPAASLEVEANIFPLTIHRDLLTCQYYSKLQQLPNDMADDLLQTQFPAEGLSSRLLPSMKSRARALFTNVNLQIPARNAAPLVSPLPPWFKVETYICTDFLSTSVSSQTN